ncbi:acetylxylan esterase [Verrucomicrobiales bacterium BCK34]|nr:acetylxylan esterase [Verrucomicrobiales bacterium BCK34]
MKSIVNPVQFLLALCSLIVLPDSFAALTVDVSTDREEALYEKGDEVTFTVTAKEGDKNLDRGDVHWVLSRGGYETLSRGNGSLEGGKGFQVKGSLGGPGFLLLTATVTGTDGKKVSAFGGAGFSPLEIEPSMDAPADFDEFWAAQKAALAEIPMEVESESEKTAEEGIEAYDVKIQCEKEGAPVSGYFAKPEKAAANSLPAVLFVHGAGVRSSSLSTAMSGARDGFLSMDINAHGSENGKPAEFYEDLKAGSLKNYTHMGRGSRDDIYFRGMFVRLMRAIDFLTSQPEWDGQVMAVVGHSQGGLQALVAGGLDERVTFIASGVPAGCDHTGMMVNRISGWPKIVPIVDGKPDPKVIEASRYIDAVNFARRCKAEAILSVGFIDRTCPPTSVYAAYNVLAGKKEMINEPKMGHARPKPVEEAFWDALKAHVVATKGVVAP